MTTSVAVAFAIALIVSSAALGASNGVKEVASKTLESIARQPEAKGPLQTTMFIGAGLVEAVPIIAVVVALMLLGNI